MDNVKNAQLSERSKELKSLVGKRVSVMCTGLLVEGVAVNFTEDEHSRNLLIHHKPVRWGEGYYTKTQAWERKPDGFGTMKHVSLIKG